MQPDEIFTSFRQVPRTGVIYVTTEAAKLGFTKSPEDWCNLGQGQPETGDLPGAMARLKNVHIALDDQEYAPTSGLWELREAVASMYNNLFRRGHGSKYSAENVCIGGGGRILLTRAAASLSQINLGHFLPDYTAYEELLDIFKAFNPIPILLEGEKQYSFSISDLKREILGRGLSGLLFSNPNNPMGKVVEGETLEGWVTLARTLDCTLLADEFYSHYVYDKDPEEAFVASAARYVGNVDKDPILLFNGLTKNWRYPGWRVSWAVGPKKIIETLASAGSFLDGGGSKPLQRAALPLLESSAVKQETMAIQRHFSRKRDFLLEALSSLGITVEAPPQGTFYIWASTANLPPPLNEGMGFFRAALAQKIITVPGEFFDVNPGKRRRGNNSRFKNHLRFSFGPNQECLEVAVSRLRQLVAAHSS